MSTSAALVHIIEDEVEIRRFLRVSLVNHNFRLHESKTAQEGLLGVSAEPPDLIVLDLGLPDLDGVEVIRRIREWSQTPIIVLSARGQEKDKIAALDAGADDYLTKPFSVGELLARIRAALRRAIKGDGSTEPIFTLHDLRVDLVARQVTKQGVEVHLTPTEYRLLVTLIRYAGKVVTHRQLLKEVWGPDSAYETHYLRVYMATLRQKIESEPARPKFLLTEPGVGYRLKPEAG
jgi:two-component system KDP operon response regulator KdpE